MTAPPTPPTDREIEEAKGRLTADADFQEKHGYDFIHLRISDLRLIVSRLSSVEGELAGKQAAIQGIYDEYMRDEECDFVKIGVLIEASMSVATASPKSLPTRTPEELESLLSLALGALEPFLRHLEPWMNERHPDERVTVFSRHTFGELRQASQVIAQIKGGQESMASSARNEPQAGPAASAPCPHCGSSLHGVS